MKKFEDAYGVKRGSSVAILCVVLLAGTLSLVLLAQVSAPIEGLIQLEAALDEPEFYCIDVPGFGSNLDLEGVLQAHTCKPGAEDELFTFNYPNEGQLYMEAYELCVEAVSDEAGSGLLLEPCDENALQFFTFTEESELVLQDSTPNELCMAVASTEGIPTGGPSHLKRDLMLVSCVNVDPLHKTWVVGVDSPN
jgi:hypothetical protein